MKFYLTNNKMKTLIKHIILLVFIAGFILSLKPHKTKQIKKEPILIIIPNFNNNGMNKADSG
jgi:hypothetical protein